MSTNDSKSSVLELLDKRYNKLIAYDFTVSLFVSALNSYRCDSVLKPFPNQYINSDNNEKQFDFLVIILQLSFNHLLINSNFIFFLPFRHKKTLIDPIPVLSKLNSNYEMSDNCWQLLNWIMTCGSVQLIQKPFNSEEVFFYSYNLKI